MWPQENRSSDAIQANAAQELSRFEQQSQALVAELQQTANQLDEQDHTDEADLIRTHAFMVEDPELVRRVRHEITQHQQTAEQAVEHAMLEIVRTFLEPGDPVLAERAADLRDLANQLRAKLSHEWHDPLPDLLADVHRPILATEELLPSVVLRAHEYNIQAFLVERGTALSHGAILARSLGLPTLRVPSLETIREHHGKRILVDADAGQLLIEPDDQEIQDRLRPAIAESEHVEHPIVRLWVSVVDPGQLEKFDWTGVRGVGLYRTEALFMRRDDFPSEAEQIRAYRKLAQLCQHRPMVIRTADLGADKTLSYMTLGPPDNPYLGLRSHRLYYFHPDIIVTQLRAILQAAAGPHRLRILYPMLESLDQWVFMQQFLHRAIQSLRDRGEVFQEHFEQGVLIEVPSAVHDFHRFLKVIDFASVGTNDLVQYMFAVERNNANVARHYQPEHPIVLHVLKTLADQARAAGKELSICGEIASDVFLLPLLAGLGLEHLSVPASAIPILQGRLKTLDVSVCREVANLCLDAQTVEEVQVWLGKCLEPPTAHAAPTSGRAVDPVCRMVVQTTDNPFSLVWNGVRNYFCSRRCMFEFSRHQRQLANQAK